MVWDESGLLLQLVTCYRLWLECRVCVNRSEHANNNCGDARLSVCPSVCYSSLCQLVRNDKHCKSLAVFVQTTNLLTPFLKDHPWMCYGTANQVAPARLINPPKSVLSEIWIWDGDIRLDFDCRYESTSFRPIANLRHGIFLPWQNLTCCCSSFRLVAYVTKTHPTVSVNTLLVKVTIICDFFYFVIE
jgi:hypothetical protein